MSYKKLLTLLFVIPTIGFAAEETDAQRIYRLSITNELYGSFLDTLASAKSGVPDAQYLLGVSYAVGIGAPINYKRAYMWLSLSRAQGNDSAQNTLNSIADEMTPAQIEEAQEQASLCWDSGFKYCE